jgi:hypothetical protein
MLLAQEYDAVEQGIPYVSTHRRRIIAPDTRSRVAGYLTTAPEAAPGYRTDGVWVWSQSLADRARTAGVAPQEQLYIHLRQRSFLLPDRISPGVLAVAGEAIHRPPTVDPAPAWDWIHLGGYTGVDASGYADAGRQLDALLRIRLREDGSVAESRYEPTGWDPGHAQRRSDPPRRRVDRRDFVEISGPEAAALNDRLSVAAHAERIERARESPPAADTLRLARLYDGESPAGTPWFSPYRLRIPEPVRRERLTAYLLGGRLVVRVGGHSPDPMDPDQGAPISLNYRTDGVWIWPESLAHYLRVRGVAPELEFLCHIEERGYRHPDDVPANLVPVAGSVLKAGPSPRLARPRVQYLWLHSGGIARVRGPAPGGTDVLRDDLRWSQSTVDLPTSAYRAITEADAVAFIDARWAAGDVLPPLD